MINSKSSDEMAFGLDLSNSNFDRILSLIAPLVQHPSNSQEVEEAAGNDFKERVAPVINDLEI
jgi:hypothetical protein